MTVTIRRTFSKEILTETTKQHRVNIIPLHPECLPYIQEKKNSSLPEAFLFTSKNGKHYRERRLQSMWRDACKKAGLTGIKLYNASRHSFASQLLNSNVPLEVISRLLGHSSLKTTQVYAKMSTKPLHSAVLKLSLKDKLSLQKSEGVRENVSETVRELSAIEKKK
jgi:site-specific recombinase XerD